MKSAVGLTSPFLSFMHLANESLVPEQLMDRTVLVPDSGCEFDIVSEHSGDSLAEQRGMRTEKQHTVEWPVLF